MPPVNDDFANAITISGATGSVEGENTAATLEVGEVIYDTPALPNGLGYGGGRDVWYNWVCPANGSYSFLVNGVGGGTGAWSGGPLRPFLTICTGAAVNALTIVGQNYLIPSFGDGALITFAATSGTTYRIAVDGLNGTAPNDVGYDINDTQEGEFTLSWTTSPGPEVSGDNVHSYKPVYGTDFAYSEKTFYNSIYAFDIQCDVRWTAFTEQQIIADYFESATFFMANQNGGGRLLGVAIRENDIYDPGHPNAKPDGYVYVLEWCLVDSLSTSFAITFDHVESDQWHTVGISYSTGDAVVVTIDGDDYTVRVAGLIFGDMKTLRWGQYSPTNKSAGDYYVRNLTVGTSGIGSTEILDDDASMEGFVAWGTLTTTGVATITRTGTAPSVVTDDFENDLWRWDVVNQAQISTGTSCNGTDSLQTPGSVSVPRVMRYMGGPGGGVGLGDYDRWAYISFAAMFDWDIIWGQGGFVNLGGYYSETGSDQVLMYLVSDTPSTGHIAWADQSAGEMTSSLPGEVWTSVVFGMRHKSSNDTFDTRVIIDGVDYGVVNAPGSQQFQAVGEILLGVKSGVAANVMYDTFSFQMDTILPEVVCPPVITLDADLINQTTFRLNANINPEGVSSVGYFEWGPLGYDNVTAPQPVEPMDAALLAIAPFPIYSYGEKTVTGVDLWMEYEVIFKSLPAGSTSGVFSAFRGIGLDEGVFIELDGGQYKFWTYYADNGPFQAVSLNTSYLVAQRYSPGFPGLSELWIDNVNQNMVVTSGLSDPITAIDVGLLIADGAETVEIRNLKVGTSRGASDVWSTDFSGSLGTIFTSTVVDPGNTLLLLPEISSPVAISEVITGLQPGTQYQFRAVRNP